MFGLGVPELILILVVVLLIFGPRKLPELGSFVGKSLKDFRDALETRGDDDKEPPTTAHGPAEADSTEPPEDEPKV